MFKRISLTVFAMAALSAAPGFAQTIKPVPVNPTNPTSGKEMYKEYCAVCHGVDGKGTGPAAPALKKVPTDLTQLAIRNKGKFPSDRVAHSIEGDVLVLSHGSADMPIWGPLFRSLGSNADIVRMRVGNLTEYVKSMQAK